MKRVRITIDPTEIQMRPLYHRLTSADAIERTALVNWNFHDAPTTFLYRIRGAFEAVAAELDAADYVAEYELLPQTDRTCYCYFAGEVTAGSQALLETFTRGSVLLVPPIPLNDDGTISLTLVGTESDVQETVGDLDDQISVRVDEIGGEGVATDSVVGALPPRQREAVETAIALGYYDLPRDVVIEDVAAELGCTMETAAEHLRKAESTVLSTLFSEGTA